MAENQEPAASAASSEAIENACAGDDLQLLEGLEAVRKRPAMYLGDTGVSGLHHLFREVIDNAIDEAMAGHCDRIEVTLGKDRSIAIEDNGRGIPVDIHDETGRSTVEVVLTDLHTGGKFGPGRLRTSAGLHGVGVSCVNALSDRFEATVRRDRGIHRIRCERGVVVTPLDVVGDCSPEEHGTTIQFLPDRSIFTHALTDEDELDLRPERLLHYMRQLAFLNREVTINFVDALHDAAPVVLHYPNAVADFVAHLNADSDVLHDVIHLRREWDGTPVEIALQYRRGDEVRIDAFVNNVALSDGGTHVTGFKSGLTRAINLFALRHNLLRRAQENFAGEDIRSGLTAVVSLRHPNPMFNSPDKSRLNNTDVEGAVHSAVVDGILEYFRGHPDTARVILDHITRAAEIRERGPKARR